MAKSKKTSNPNPEEGSKDSKTKEAKKTKNM
jgi:hypothetical protein